MKEQAISIVNEMVKNGYYLFDETPENFAARFDYDVITLNDFLAAHLRRIEKEASASF